MPNGGKRPVQGDGPSQERGSAQGQESGSKQEPVSTKEQAGGTPTFSATDFGVPTTVRCPFCERDETELHSAFGGQLSTSTYWCRHCRTAFEWFKWESS